MHDYKNAADTLKQALEMQPDNPRLQSGLANNLMLSDRVEEALDIFQKLADEDPTNVQPKLRIAEIYRVKRDYAKAAEALNKAKALNPQDMEVRYEECQPAGSAGQVQRGHHPVEGPGGRNVRPKYSASEGAARVTLLEELASLYRTNGQYTEAIDTYRKAAALNKENSDAISLQIIDTYRAAKNTESGAQGSRCEGSGNAQPDQWQTRAWPATCCWRRSTRRAGTSPRRARCSTRRRRLPPLQKRRNEFTSCAAPCSSARKRWSLPKPNSAKCWPPIPKHFGALNYLGYMLVDHNLRVDEATQMIKKALEGDPENGAYLDSLGWAYYQQGKFEEAEGLLTRAIDRIGPGSHGSRPPGRRVLEARQDSRKRSRSGRRR